MKAELERLVGELKGSEGKLRGRAYHAANWCAADWLQITREKLTHILTTSNWIPASERLPTGDRIWCWVERKDAEFGVVRSLAHWLKGGFCWPGTVERIERVLRWQPIEEPAPYRAEGGGG